MSSLKHPQQDCVDEMNLTISSIIMRAHSHSTQNHANKATRPTSAGSHACPIIRAHAMSSLKHPQQDCVDEMNLTISSIIMRAHSHSTQNHANKATRPTSAWSHACPIIRAHAMSSLNHPQHDCVDEMNLTISSILIQAQFDSTQNHANKATRPTSA